MMRFGSKTVYQVGMVALVVSFVFRYGFHLTAVANGFSLIAAVLLIGGLVSMSLQERRAP